jgi:hypothetical protein
MDLYRVTRFKIVQGTRQIYGGKSFYGSLARAHKRLVKLFGGQAKVKVLGPGHYEIAGGEAELRIQR